MPKRHLVNGDNAKAHESEISVLVVRVTVAWGRITDIDIKSKVNEIKKVLFSD